MTKNETVLETALTRFRMAEDFDREDKLLMEEDLSFAAGEQWPLDIEDERRRTDRPCLVFNRLPAFVSQVTGDARQNRPSIKVHPVDDAADVERAEIFEGLIRNIEGQSRSATAYITALSHAVTGSRGAWRVVTEYTTDDAFEQDIRIKRITNPFAVSWDPGAKEYDKSDAQWCFVSEWMTKEVFTAKYPKATPMDWKGEYKRFRSYDHWLADDRVRVAEYWVKEPVTKTLSLLTNGEVVEGDLPEIIIRNGMVVQVAKERKVKTHKVVRYLMSGAAVLEGPSEFPSRYIPIVPCFGPEEFVGDRVRYRSLIRYAKDPQRMYNYWQTTIAEKIALAPKSPWLVTLNMIKGLKELWANANRENRPYLPYNPDPEAPGAMPKRQEPAYVNAAEIQQSQQAIDDLKATMGMFDASLGAQGNETSGKAIIARQREGDTSTYEWLDNLARSIEHTGRILIDMIPRVYDTQRIIRVLGEDDTVDMVPINWVSAGQLMNDITVGKYDVAITVGPSYQTKRMEAADSLMQFVQALPQTGEVAGDLIAKSMDWPGADEIADRLKKTLPPGLLENEDEDDPETVIAEMNGQIQQLMQQIEEMGEALEKADLSELELTRAKTFKEAMAGEAQRIKNQAVEAGIAPVETL